MLYLMHWLKSNLKKILYTNNSNQTIDKKYKCRFDLLIYDLLFPTSDIAKLISVVSNTLPHLSPYCMGVDIFY